MRKNKDMQALEEIYSKLLKEEISFYRDEDGSFDKSIEEFGKHWERGGGGPRGSMYIYFSKPIQQNTHKNEIVKTLEETIEYDCTGQEFPEGINHIWKTSDTLIISDITIYEDDDPESDGLRDYAYASDRIDQELRSDGPVDEGMRFTIVENLNTLLFEILDVSYKVKKIKTVFDGDISSYGQHLHSRQTGQAGINIDLGDVGDESEDEAEDEDQENWSSNTNVNKNPYKKINIRITLDKNVPNDRLLRDAFLTEIEDVIYIHYSKFGKDPGGDLKTKWIDNRNIIINNIMLYDDMDINDLKITLGTSIKYVEGDYKITNLVLSNESFSSEFDKLVYSYLK